MRFAKNLFANLIVALMLSVPLHSYAQGDTLEIFEMEYFFNVDPGFGSATPIAVPVPDSTISALELISTAGLSTGFHVLGLRARNVATNPKFNVLDTGTFIIEPAQLIDPILRSAGQWGITETRLVFVDQSDAGSIVEVDQMEYFFDVDPGVGSAVPINSFAQGNQISIIETLASDTLSIGFHLLGFRARAVGGAWGTTETRLIYVDPSNAGGPVNVDQIEYFFDEDPGVGAATQLPPFTAANVVSLIDSISTNTLSVGFHIVGMRARAEGGNWGTTETRLLYVDPSNAGAAINVDQIEYFFDEDPGIGSATQLAPFAAANVVSLIDSVNTNTLSVGFHVLGMRARAEGGVWGTTESRLIFVDQGQGVTTVDQLEYFFDEDPGVGLATQLSSFSPASAVSTVELLNSTSLSQGFHIVGMRARSASGTWGTTETKLIFVDGVSGVSDVTDFEYFIGDDPGVGLAANVPISSPGVSVSQDVLFATDTLSIGSYQVNVRARDANGTWGITESRSFEVVNVLPPVISSPEASPTNNSSIEISVTWAEAVTSFDSTDIQIDSASMQPGSFTVVNDSTYTFFVELSTEGIVTINIPDSAAFALDDAQPSPAAIPFELEYDITPPTITVDTLTSDQISPALSGTVNDSLATISLTVIDSTYTTAVVSGNTWNLPAGVISPVTDGSYDIIAQAVDLAGNVGIDTTANELTISGSAFSANAPTQLTDTSFQANWSLGPDAASYELEVSNAADFSTFLPGFDPLVVNQTNAIVGNLDFSTNYFYRVRFRNSADQLSANSNAVQVKTLVDSLTLADSLALVQVYESLNGADWSGPVNWENARLRDWDGITLTAGRNRVREVSIPSRGASGEMSVGFQGAIAGGLSELTAMDVSDNDISGLMDFSGTSISNLNVSGNRLEFDDLEILVGISQFSYSPQASIGFSNVQSNETFLIPHLSDTVLRITTGGTSNTYSYFRNGITIQGQPRLQTSGSDLEISQIDFENMGTFTANVSNDLLPDLALEVQPVTLLAVADVTVSTVNSAGGVVEEEVVALLLELGAAGSAYDTTQELNGVSGTFVFSDVVLSNYLSLVDPVSEEAFVPTYLGDEFEWTLAETLLLRSDTSLSIRVVDVPPDPSDGEGSLQVTIEEDFGEPSARVDARRRAKGRKCGLKRRVRGGRPGQSDEFVLFAYGETDDNGQFEFGFLPEGTYRFFVEYPGIPLDESAVVEFSVGEQGISDTEFKLEAFATEGGVQVSIERILGVIFEYFKDLRVYPNPASDQVHISYRFLRSEVRVQLMDLTGKVLWSEEIRAGYDQQKLLDVSQLQEGIYLLQFFDEKDGKEGIVSYRIQVKD